jgi:hypothetical protein
MANQNFGSAASVTQTSEVHIVQYRNPKGNQKYEGKIKAKVNKGKGDKKVSNNSSEGKMKRRRFIFCVSFAQMIT